MSQDPSRLLGGHATDTLTEAERRELLRAALDDQALFERLLEEEGLRELLRTPGAHDEVLAAMDRPGRLQRLRDWLGRPATLGDLVAVAGALALAAAAAVVYRSASEPRPPSAAARPAVATPLAPETLASLAALPAGRSVPVTIAWAPPGPAARVRSGEALRVTLTAHATTRVVLLDVSPDGPAVQAWPAPGAPPALVAAPASGTPAVRALRLTAPSRPGPHRLRLVAVPPGVDLGAVPPPTLERLASRLTLIDLPYELEGR